MSSKLKDCEGSGTIWSTKRELLQMSCEGERWKELAQDRGQWKI
jgi:hypothetical protein